MTNSINKALKVKNSRNAHWKLGRAINIWRAKGESPLLQLDFN